VKLPGDSLFGRGLPHPGDLDEALIVPKMEKMAKKRIIYSFIVDRIDWKIENRQNEQVAIVQSVANMC